MKIQGLQGIIYYLTVPPTEDLIKRAGKALGEFRDLVYPSDYTPGAKRKVRSDLYFISMRLSPQESNPVDSSFFLNSIIFGLFHVFMFFF